MSSHPFPSSSQHANDPTRAEAYASRYGANGVDQNEFQEDYSPPMSAGPAGGGFPGSVMEEYRQSSYSQVAPAGGGSILGGNKQMPLVPMTQGPLLDNCEWAPGLSG